MSHRDTIRDALKKGPKSLEALRATKVPSLSVVLYQLVANGTLRKDGRGESAIYTLNPESAAPDGSTGRSKGHQKAAADTATGANSFILNGDDAFLVSLTKDRRLLMQKDGIPFMFSPAETKALAELLA